MDRRIAARMTQHVVDTAAKHRVTLRWVNGWGRAESYPGQPIAMVPVIREPYEYLIALHELGHCVDPMARKLNDSSDPRDEILCESAAWAWAATHVHRPLARHLRAGDWDRAAYAWRTYLAAASGWRRRRAA